MHFIKIHLMSFFLLFCIINPLFCVQKKGKKIAIYQYQKNKEDTKQCIICLDEIKQEKKLSCGHSYDEKCIDEWIMRLYQMKNELDCPICRKIIQPVDLLSLRETFRQINIDKQLDTCIDYLKITYIGLSMCFLPLLFYALMKAAL